MIIVITQRDAAPPIQSGVATGLVALGVNQATAYLMTAETNIFTIVSSGSGAQVQEYAGRKRQRAVNRGANPLAVYPPFGERFDNLAVNAPVTIDVGEDAAFVSTGGGRWAVEYGGWLFASQNLADLPDPDAAWAVLGGGPAGKLPVGNTAGSVAAGDDPRIALAIPNTVIAQPDGLATLGTDGRLTSAQVPSGLTAGVTARGVWNAATNTPTLTSSVGTNGDMWAVSVAGSTNLNGTSTWAVGDQAWFTGGTWQRVPLAAVIASMSLTSLAQIGFSDLSMVGPSNPLVRNIVWSWTANLRVAGLLDRFGKFWFADARVNTLAVNDATLSTVTADDAVVNSLGMAGVNVRSGSLVRGWSWLFQDPDGRGSVGVRNDGSFRAKVAHVETLTADTLTVGDGSNSPVAAIIPSDPLVRGDGLDVVDTAGAIGLRISKTGEHLSVPRFSIITRAVQTSAKPTHIHTYTPPRTGTDETIASGTTICTVWSLDLPFDYVQVIGGMQLPVSSTVSGVIASSAGFNDGVNPIDNLGAAAPFTQLTWNGGGSTGYTPRTQPTGSNLSLAVTGSSLDQVWNLFASDWVQKSSLYRTDGSPYPLLFCRLYMTGTPAAVAVSGANWFGTGPTIYTDGRTWAAYEAAGDYVSSVSGFPSSGLSFGTHWAPLMIRTYSRALGFQFWGCGDSNMAGTGSSFGFGGFYRRTGVILGRRRPNIWSNFNQPGSSAEIYMENVARIMPIARPSVVGFPMTFNSAATQATMERNFGRWLEIAEMAAQAGNFAVPVAYPPRGGVTAAADLVRLESIARIDQWIASGGAGVNVNSRIAVPGAPQTWVPEMTIDNTHFSEIGHQVVHDEIMRQVMPRIGI